ncbi:acetylornithine aminotransferase [Rothia aerolata]|uniref:Acetylornithine aminotransferase n=1 Tax=Rothia aerolata TaxID=1812262 RepID=A0A917IUC1_9MICC|nr:acetylornithine transaminase [Rothia aerolata]GGH63865.1 acetylornithine aminotransferase [Rothia aerolata]
MAEQTEKKQQDLLKDYRRDLLGVFGDPSLVLVSGSGATVTDANGKEYLDLLAGIAVNSLGHGHPAWSRAVSEQAGKLAHISNFFTSPSQLVLAHKLLDLFDSADEAKVFFCNSGTEANEAAYKLARRHGNLTGKKTILALEQGFHGRTIGALSLTHKPAYRQPFEPLPSGVVHIPATLEALETHLTDDVAAIIVEPIQGEAGVLPLPQGYLTRARELTRQHNALLIVDEVQTGMGRTGRYFEHTRELDGQNLPDAVTLAKGLGGGFPIGAMITNGALANGLLEAGMHGTTFGGNPLATAAALATLTVLDEENLLEAAVSRGESVRAQLEALDCVAATRGAGLLIGVQLAAETTEDGAALAPAVVAAAREAGFIINAPNASTIRLAPPLVVTEEQLASFVQALPKIVETSRVS